MRVILTTILILFVITFSFGQVPGTKWTNYYQTYGSNEFEVFYDIKATPDSGFILAGGDSAFIFNKNDYLANDISQDFAMPWLVKVDKNGSVVWRFSYQGYPQPYMGSFNSVIVESNGDIVSVGYGSVFSGYPIELYISKLSANGTQLWYKAYGGNTGTTKGFSLQKTNDGGYIVAGMTTANDGDVSGNHNAGNSDVWLLKLDNNGTIQWKRCYGGSGNDSAYSVIQTPDNGFVIAGSSTSSDGDLSSNNGLSDGWIFKVDNSGNLLWQKTVGGTGYDDLKVLF